MEPVVKQNGCICKLKTKPRWAIKIICIISIFFLASMPIFAQASEVEESEFFDKSGANSMFDSLDSDTKSLLQEAGVENAEMQGGFNLEQIFGAVSNLIQDKVARPFQIFAAITAVIIICKLCNCFENSQIGDVSAMVGSVVCAVLMVTPLVDMIQKTAVAVKGASVFLLASVPVYSTLMVVSGNVASASSYSFLTVIAANALPIIATTVLIPLLNIILAFAVAASFSDLDLKKITDRIYQFMKWLLILSVTIFSGILSVQTLLSASVDSAAKKTAKLITSSAIPIVGGAIGDSLSLIESSIDIVKSGAGAFGLLAAIMIFLPIILESAVWIGICSAAEIVADLFETPRIGFFLKTCASVSKAILSIVASIAMVCIICASIVILSGGAK